MAGLTCTLKTDSFAVYDNVLSPEKQSDLLSFVNEVKLISVHEKDRNETRFLFTGDPQVSVAYLSKQGDGFDDRNEDGSPADFSLFYPTGDYVDDIFELIKNNQDEFSDLIGEEGRDWERHSASAFAYAQNASVTWHRDANTYSGAFIYYLTTNWKPQWGGELFIGNRNEENIRLMNGTEQQEFTDQEISFGHFVAPLANRLVILKGGTPHKVSTVTQSAGDAVRYSITGFFNRPYPKLGERNGKLTSECLVYKLPTRYISRKYGDEASLLARNYGSAIASIDHLPIFDYISAATEPFSATDLPGDFPLTKKLEILQELLDIEALA